MLDAPYTPDQWMIVQEMSTPADLRYWRENGWPSFEDVLDRSNDFKQMGSEDEFELLLNNGRPPVTISERVVAVRLMRNGAQYGSYMPGSVAEETGLTREAVGQIALRVARKLPQPYAAVFLAQIDD